MSSDKHVTPLIVNTLAVNGFLNGVINLAYSTAHWFPAEDGKSVSVAEPITVDLRMDLACAMTTRDALDRIIEAQTRPKPQDVN